MNTQTIQRLNAINREFYQITAHEFDQTRGTAWPGWERLLPYLRPPLTVLDVGCGNGRFGLFLHEKAASPQPAVPNTQKPFEQPSPQTLLPQGEGQSFLPFSLPLTPGDEDKKTSQMTSQPSALSPQHFLVYHGVDNNAALLERARAALAGRPGLTAAFEERDIVENPPDAGSYDLVVLFGVLHHVPGFARRQDLLRRLAARVKPGGLLMFAAWRFYEYDRFRERIIPWPADIEVEPHDYLLDWRRGQPALRYCHYIDDAEQNSLVDACGLRLVMTYRADGQDGRANAYSLLRQE